MTDKTTAEAALDMLGHRATDRVTGFTGVISSMCFDLYGCIQVLLTPKAKDDADKIEQGPWFDVNRLQLLDEAPVMDRPAFRAPELKPTAYQHGAAEKPHAARHHP
jgi:hypothetical protein